MTHNLINIEAFNNWYANRPKAYQNLCVEWENYPAEESLIKRAWIHNGINDNVEVDIQELINDFNAI